jgi:hypothetical protein
MPVSGAIARLTCDRSQSDKWAVRQWHQVDEKLGNFENREIDKRLQLEVRVGRLEKQRS